MKIELTLEHANALLNILDIAVKAEGLRVAQAALFFGTLLQEAVKKESKEKEEQAPVPVPLPLPDSEAK